MRSRPGIPSPSGNDADAEYQRSQFRRAGSELRPKNSTNVKWQQTTHGFVPKFNFTAFDDTSDSPFRIYQSSTWLKFKVTTGWVIATSDAFVPTNVETELTITSGVSKFYFVLTILSASTASISTSSTLPVWGVDVIPIGWVDTDTYSADSRSVIHQFLHDNVFSPCVT